MPIRTVTVDRFKVIEHARVDLGQLSVIVGSNRSGKSSLIQGIHFAISALQTIKLAGLWPTNATGTISTSSAPNQFIYSPADDALDSRARWEAT